MNYPLETILIVDDSDVEYDLICWGFEQNGITCPILRAQTAEEGLDRLGINPADPQSPIGQCPTLILLDLSMPGLGGFGFLKVLKRLPEPLGIPVVVVSSSNNPADITISYQLGATAFFKKPDNVDEYAEKTRDILLICFE